MKQSLQNLLGRIKLFKIEIKCDGIIVFEKLHHLNSFRKTANNPYLIDYNYLTSQGHCFPNMETRDWETVRMQNT